MGKYVKKIFAGSSNPRLAAKIAEECGVSLGDVTIKRFSDGEIWAVSYTHLTLPTNGTV